MRLLACHHDAVLAPFAAASAQVMGPSPPGPVVPDRESGQRPPAVRSGQKPPAARDCVSERSDFQTRGKAAIAIVELTNNCEMRIRCKVSANVTTSFGSRTGSAVLVLAPKSRGAASRKALTIPVRQASGSVDETHDCRPI